MEGRLREEPSFHKMCFREYGVGKENIALFFFAKDLECYDKIYKVWLENMMNNDLALKGNVNGVELLIFPSNQLPENSQYKEHYLSCNQIVFPCLRSWNMLFFLWGVFRGNKESCLQHSSVSLKQFSAPRNLPPAIMSLPENRCSPRPMAKDLPACDDVPPETKVHASEDLYSLLSTRAVNEGYIIPSKNNRPATYHMHHALEVLDDTLRMISCSK